MRIYIDFDLCFKKITSSKDEWCFDDAMHEHLTLLQQENPGATFHILVNDNHVFSAPKENTDFHLRLFPNNPPYALSSTQAIKKLLSTLHPEIFSESIEFFYAERLAQERFKTHTTLVSEFCYFVNYFSHFYPIQKKPAVAPSKPKAAPEYNSRDDSTFRLDPTHFNHAAKMIREAGNLPIKLFFDLDDTIIDYRKCVEDDRIVLNKALVNGIAGLLNSLPSLENIECTVVSARPDDDSPNIAVKAKTAVDEFVTAVNEKIKDNHPAGITFAAIHCLQEHTGCGKKIVAITQKEKTPAVTERKFTKIRESFSVNPDLHDLTEYFLIWNDLTNKSHFLRLFIIPEIEKITQEFVALFFDDNLTQLTAINNLRDPRFHCIQIIQQSALTLSSNPYGITHQFPKPPLAPIPKPSFMRTRKIETEEVSVVITHPMS